MQRPLFVQQQTWGHYIGRTTYPSDDDFIGEAITLGVSRRVPAFLARKMNFGDRVVLLRWLGHGNAQAFAEMVITGVTLDEMTAAAVAETLGDRAECSADGATKHQRGCGMYTIAITCIVHDVTLPEIIEKAQAVMPKPFVMLQGRLVQIISPPKRLTGMRFTRGFFRFERAEQLFSNKHREGAMTGVRDYTHETKANLGDLKKVVLF